MAEYRGEPRIDTQEDAEWAAFEEISRFRRENPTQPVKIQPKKA
jgi:hypothetical protein